MFAKDINTARELCAAKKIIPSLKVFKFSKVEEEDSFYEVPEDQHAALHIVPTLLENSTDFDFVLGGGDTCQVGNIFHQDFQLFRIFPGGLWWPTDKVDG